MNQNTGKNPLDPDKVRGKTKKKFTISRKNSFMQKKKVYSKLNKRTRLLTAQVEVRVKNPPNKVFSSVLSDGFSLFSHSGFPSRCYISRALNLETDLLWRCDHNCAVNSCSGQILRDRQMLVTRPWKQRRRQVGSVCGSGSGSQ
jgi:hypothetical protein